MRRSVLVIRRDDRFSGLLREAGFEVLNLELIRTQPARDLSDLDEKLRRLNEYDGLFFTSSAAAEVFARRVDPVSFSGKIYVLGERSREVLEEKGFEVVFQPGSNTAEELIGSFQRSEFEGKRFLFVRGDRSLRTIPELLNGTAVVDEVVVYETAKVLMDGKRIDELKEVISSGDIGWVCFFSPSGAEEFTRIFEESYLRKLKAAAIGKTTAKEAAKSGLNVRYISPRSESEVFARGLVEHIKEVE